MKYIPPKQVKYYGLPADPVEVWNPAKVEDVKQIEKVQ